MANLESCMTYINIQKGFIWGIQGAWKQIQKQTAVVHILMNNLMRPQRSRKVNPHIHLCLSSFCYSKGSNLTQRESRIYMKQWLEKMHKQPLKQRWTQRSISFPKQASAMLDLRALQSPDVSFRLEKILDYFLISFTVSTKKVGNLLQHNVVDAELTVGAMRSILNLFR